MADPVYFPMTEDMYILTVFIVFSLVYAGTYGYMLYLGGGEVSIDDTLLVGVVVMFFSILWPVFLCVIGFGIVVLLLAFIVKIIYETVT